MPATENTTATRPVIVMDVPVALLDEFRRISDVWDRSMSEEVRRAMREYVERESARSAG